MRIYDDQLAPALAALRRARAALRPTAPRAPTTTTGSRSLGADDARLPDERVTDPRELCGAQPVAFVRPCWYRAFVDNRPEGIEVDSPEHLDVLCEGLDGLQREACITGAAVIGPADPAAQLEDLRRPRDRRRRSRAASAARRCRTCSARPTRDYVRLIGGCELFAGTTRAACYRWLGKALAVLTDGAFEQTRLPGARQRGRAAPVPWRARARWRRRSSRSAERRRRLTQQMRGYHDHDR